MILLITKYNLSPKWLQIIMFFIFYFILLKLHFLTLTDSTVECMTNTSLFGVFQSNSEKVNLLGEQIEDHDKLLGDIKQNISETQSKVNDLEKNVRHILERRNLQVSQIARINSLEQQSSIFETKFKEIEDLKTNLEQVQQENITLRNDYIELKNDYSELSKRMVDFQATPQPASAPSLAQSVFNFFHNTSTNHTTTTHTDSPTHFHGSAVISPNNSSVSITENTNTGPGTLATQGGIVRQSFEGDRVGDNNLFNDCCGCFRTNSGDVTTNVEQDKCCGIEVPAVKCTIS